MKCHSKLLVSYICHTEIIICITKFTIVNILGGIPCQEILTTTSTYKVLIKFLQSINEELLKIRYLIIPTKFFWKLYSRMFCCVTSQLPLQDFQNIGRIYQGIQF